MSSLPLTATAPLRAPAPRWLAPRRRSVVLVANASASGLGRSPETLELARRAMKARGAAVETHLTSSLAELAALWPDLVERRVALLGGDGTLHAAANLPFAQPELAILPAGRANNVARSLGVPVDIAAAAELAVEGSPRSIDLIAASTPERRYLAVEGVSVGFHAVARATYDAPNSADVSAAVRSALTAVRSFRGVTASVSSDGAGEILRLGQLFVANFSLYGPGLRVAPEARPDDGLLDLVALEWNGRASLVPMLARLRRGTHVGRPGVRTWTASRIRIATGGQSPVIADTTDLGSGVVTLEVAPAALTVVAP